MEHLKTLFELKQEITPFKGSNNRQYILSLIISELDKNVGKKYTDKKGKERIVEKVSPRWLGVKCSHLSEFDLMHHHETCLKSNIEYSRAFWGNIKPRKVIHLAY